MKKLILTVVSFLVMLPSIAGQYEDALRTGQPVLLYLYSKDCSYCKTFNPMYEKLFQNHKNTYRFVKVDANSPYGGLLVRDMMAGYVPFVVLADAKRHYLTVINPDCIVNNACIEGEMKSFLK